MLIKLINVWEIRFEQAVKTQDEVKTNKSRAKTPKANKNPEAINKLNRKSHQNNI